MFQELLGGVFAELRGSQYGRLHGAPFLLRCVFHGRRNFVTAEISCAITPYCFCVWKLTKHRKSCQRFELLVLLFNKSLNSLFLFITLSYYWARWRRVGGNVLAIWRVHTHLSKCVVSWYWCLVVHFCSQVQWNKFSPRVFLSASADWSVKMWEVNQSRPMMTFDLGAAVGDAAWYCTIFSLISPCVRSSFFFVVGVFVVDCSCSCCYCCKWWWWCCSCCCCWLSCCCCCCCC